MAGFASAGGTTRNPWQNIPGNNAVTGAGVPVPQNGFGAFNKNTANQANKYLGGQGLPDVWGGANQRFQGLTDKIGNSLFADGAPWSGGGIWGGQFRPGPDSPLLGGYLENQIGGIRRLANSSNDFGGPSRASSGVVGSGDPRAAAAYNKTKAIAEGFGDIYSRSYDMASRDWTNMSNLWGQGLSAYGNLANTELGALRGASDYNLGQGNIGAQLNAQNLQGVGQEADNNWKYWKDITDWQRGGADRDWQERQRAQQQNVWDRAKYDMQAKDMQSQMDKAMVQRQNWRGQGGGWLDSGPAGDAAMRLAAAEGRDWWRDPARGGGGGSSGGGGGNNAASWAGFTSGLLRGAGA